MIQVANGFTSISVSEAQWGPFLVPGEEFSLEDAGKIAKTNLLQWALGLPQPLVMQVHPLSSDVIGELMMEALAAQTVLALPGLAFDVVMPRETLGRVVTVSLEPHKKADPPVPMLVLAGLGRDVEQYHNAGVIDLLKNGSAATLKRFLPTVMAEMVGVLNRSEVFYYLFRVQSLVTGVYRQRYDTAHVI